MNKQEFLADLARLDVARTKAKADYEAFISHLEKDERRLCLAYAAEHALYKKNELVVVHDWNETLVDTIFAVKARVVTYAEGPIVAFDYYRTGNGQVTVSKDKLEAIPEKEQESIRKEAMSKVLCKVGDDVLYINTPYKVIGIYVRTYKDVPYPVYHIRNPKSGYKMFATTHDFNVGNCVLVDREKKEEKSEGLAT